MLVESERATEDPAPGATGAPAEGGLGGGLPHLLARGQAEVVVRPQHDDPPSADQGNWALIVLHGEKEWIAPHQPEVLWLGKPAGLGEDVVVVYVRPVPLIEVDLII